jgi:hypothetical protein
VNPPVFHRDAPLFPRTPITPGRRSDGVWKAAATTPPPGTLPHPLENAARFPQTTGHDGEVQEKGGCTLLIVAAAQK